MSVKSSLTRYGSVVVTVHWLTALLILALLLGGFLAAEQEDAVAKASLLKVHIPLAVLTVAITFFRIGWWWLADTKPSSLPMPAWQERGARAVHLLMYIVVLGMAASGVGMLVLSGAGDSIFGGDPVRMPDFSEFLPRYPHGIGARLIVVLVVMHGDAALYHQFIKKDGLLRRMWYR